MLTTKQKLIPLALTAALGLHAQTATALPYQLSLSAETSATSGADSDSNGGTTSGNRTSSYSQAGNNNNSEYYFSTSASTSGSTEGRFYANATGNGPSFSAMSTFTQTYDITNDTGLDQLLDFDFTVNRGSLGIFSNTVIDANSTSEYAVSGYSAEIFVNGNSVWNSSATLNQDGMGTTLTQFGTALNTYNANNSYFSWDEQDFNLALGQLNAGENLNVKYVVNTYVEGNFNNNINCYEYDGVAQTVRSIDGVQLEVVNDNQIIDEECYYNEVSSRFGDPNRFNNNPALTDPFTARAINPNPVSEPGTIALIGAGLAGLAVVRRRKEKKA